MNKLRFAPSPTGDFHLGNLRTAWISHELARQWQMDWVLRFEDIDRPRVIPGAQTRQLSDLRELGLFATEVLVQSQFHSRHSALLERAIDEGRVYPCFCSRKDIQEDLAASFSAPHSMVPVYSGRCRSGSEHKANSATIGWRFKTEQPTGDFIVGRSTNHDDKFDARHFTPSYHWACAIDDWEGDYGVLVRAADLSSSLEPQREIQRWLKSSESSGRRLPAVFHTSLVVRDAQGQRLEKRTQGVTLEELRKAGWTTAQIIEKFKESFEIQKYQDVPMAEAVLGETREKITLAELGF